MALDAPEVEKWLDTNLLQLIASTPRKLRESEERVAAVRDNRPGGGNHGAAGQCPAAGAVQLQRAL